MVVLYMHSAILCFCYSGCVVVEFWCLDICSCYLLHLLWVLKMPVSVCMIVFIYSTTDAIFIKSICFTVFLIFNRH